ncbi:MAG: sarcosine oxidase subunit gamma family protein [Candidatus Competibacteraceae bacterium]|nr:sarcosine oxidase subunit gamma family protein [Candidatus Competibacteraceae bacterium]
MSRQNLNDGIRRESPLVGFELEQQITRRPGKAGVLMGELPFQGFVNLRGDPEDDVFLKAVAGVLGADLPVAPNTVAEGDGVVAYWLGPDEWLLATAPDGQGELERRLRGALEGQHTAVTDITGGQTVIVIQGSHGAELLAKATPLDIHPRVFGVGQCAQTRLAKAGGLIRPLEGGGFELVVRRSFADYLWLWLRDAAQEYGLAVVEPAQPRVQSNVTPLSRSASA